MPGDEELCSPRWDQIQGQRSAYLQVPTAMTVCWAQESSLRLPGRWNFGLQREAWPGGKEVGGSCPRASWRSWRMGILELTLRGSSKASEERPAAALSSNYQQVNAVCVGSFKFPLKMSNLCLSRALERWCTWGWSDPGRILALPPAGRVSLSK